MDAAVKLKGVLAGTGPFGVRPALGPDNVAPDHLTDELMKGHVAGALPLVRCQIVRAMIENMKLTTLTERR